MKKITQHSIALVIVILGLVVSCKDFEPAIPYENLKFGAYMRTIAIEPPGTFNLFDLANSRFTITVEYVDGAGGNLLDSYDIYGKKRRGTSETAEAFIKSIPRSAFSPDPGTGYLRATFSITYNEVKAAIGFDDSDVEGGDSFDFRADLRLTDGRVYNASNTGTDITGGAFFRSPFFYRVNVVCPVIYNLVGTWSTTASGDFGDGSGGSAATYTGLTATVVITEVEEGIYMIDDLSFGLYPQGYGDLKVPGRIRDVCNDLVDLGDTDHYGDPFTITGVIINENSFTLTWRNTWGDTGTVTASRI